MDLAALDVDWYAPAIVEGHSDLRRLANGEDLPVGDCFEGKARRKLWRRYPTVLHQQARRIEPREDRFLLFGWRGRYT